MPFPERCKEGLTRALIGVGCQPESVGGVEPNEAEGDWLEPPATVYLAVDLDNSEGTAIKFSGGVWRISDLSERKLEDLAAVRMREFDNGLTIAVLALRTRLDELSRSSGGAHS